MGGDAQIFSKGSSALSDAVAACGKDGSSKCWCVITCGGNALKDVHAALKDGNGRLGVVLVAGGSTPAKQTEVLRAMEYGAVYVGASELSSSRAAAMLKDATTFVD